MLPTPNAQITSRDLCNQAVVERVLANESVTSIKVAASLESDNYVAGTSGWKIERSTGNAEFNDITIRGDLESGNWDGATPANLATEDTAATQGFYLDSSTGSAQFEGNLYIEGDMEMGGTLTMSPGGIIQTATSGNRVELAEPGKFDGLHFYGTFTADPQEPGSIAPVAYGTHPTNWREGLRLRSPEKFSDDYGEIRILSRSDTADIPAIQIIHGPNSPSAQIHNDSGSATWPSYSYESYRGLGFYGLSSTAMGVSAGAVKVSEINADYDITDQAATLQATTTDPTMGSGSTSTVKWFRAGNIIHAYYTFIFGTSGAANGSGNYYVWPEDDGLPAVHSSWGTAASDRATVGWFEAEDATGGNAGHHAGSVRFEPDVSPARFVFFSHGVATYSDTIPFSWSNNDRIFIKLEYPTDP